MKNPASQKIPGAAKIAHSRLRCSRGGGEAACDGAVTTGTVTTGYDPPALNACHTFCQASWLAASSSSSR